MPPRFNFIRFLGAFRGSPKILRPFQNSNGAAALVSRKNYEAFILASRRFGRPDSGAGTQFVAPYRELLGVIKNTYGDATLLEKALGLDRGALGPKDSIVLAHVPFPHEHGLRATVPGVAGANAQFLAGGRTSGGVTEALINRVATDSMAMMPSDQEGLISWSNVRFFNMEALRGSSWLARALMTAPGHSVEE